MPVDAATKDFLLRAQFRSMMATYRQDYPDARWEVVELMDEPIGRLVTDVCESCVTYVDIALLPSAQGRGLATRLMIQALEEPRRLGLPVRVNVLEGNVASLKLCQRIGFVRLDEIPPFVRLEWRGSRASTSTARANGVGLRKTRIRRRFCTVKDAICGMPAKDLLWLRTRRR